MLRGESLLFPAANRFETEVTRIVVIARGSGSEIFAGTGADLQRKEFARRGLLSDVVQNAAQRTLE